MKCSECGKKIDLNSKYCSHCGKKQEETKVKKQPKKASSDKKIVLIVVSILVSVFAVLCFIFLAFSFVVLDEMQKEAIDFEENEKIIETYRGKLPVLKRDYKQVHTVDQNTLADITPQEALTHLKQIGFTKVTGTSQTYDDECVYEVSAQTNPYENVASRDRVILCYGTDQKINEIKIEFIFTASDFDYTKAMNEVLNVSYNFHHLPLNQQLMKDAFEELRSDMRKFEKYPSASREEMINTNYDVEYEFQYDDETTYSPALYTIELNIEKNKEGVER